MNPWVNSHFLRKATVMSTLTTLEKKDVVELLQRCWMTHDGMWFYHCLKAFGIEKANGLNKAAIKSLAPLEIGRMEEVLGLKKGKIETFQELKDFFVPVSELFIPAFMNISITFPRENTLGWAFAPQNCFAYKGIKRIGAIEQYECGAIYRLACWFDCLGLTYRQTPEITGCLMLKDGTCSGEFTFYF
jgi:hypothetical protein